MSKKIAILCILPCILILAGCGTLLGYQTNSAPQVLVVTATPEPKEIVVTATPEPVQYIIVTATPEPTSDQPTATATATATELPTATSAPSITMANTYLLDNHTIYVSWNADGYIPSGFEVVWSTTNPSPLFPGDSSTYVSDVNARTATIQTDPGKVYYIRVCRYINGVCDVYSNVTAVSSGNYVQQYQYQNPPYYPQPTQPYYYTNHPAPTATPSSPYITLTSIVSTGYEKAAIRWRAVGSFPNGFLILYSTSSSTPTYGDYSAYTISNPNARYADVSGVKDTTYYFRICRYNVSSCDMYSNVYSFTFK